MEKVGVRPRINPPLFMEAGLRSPGLPEVEDASRRLAGLKGHKLLDAVSPAILSFLGGRPASNSPSSSLLSLGNRLKTLNLISDACMPEKSSKIGH